MDKVTDEVRTHANEDVRYQERDGEEDRRPNGMTRATYIWKVGNATDSTKQKRAIVN